MGAATHPASRPTAGRRPVASGRATTARAAAVAGGLGVVAAIFPLGWPAGLALAVLAVALGVRVMRRGPAAPGFSSARTAVALGLIAGLLALVSAGMWLAGS